MCGGRIFVVPLAPPESRFRLQQKKKGGSGNKITMNFYSTHFQPFPPVFSPFFINHKKYSTKFLRSLFSALPFSLSSAPPLLVLLLLLSFEVVSPPPHSERKLPTTRGGGGGRGQQNTHPKLGCQKETKVPGCVSLRVAAAVTMA